MILRALKRLHQDQRGFTLIEVLVVMTILGILAAIVSISLLGATSNARAKAKNAELHTIQAAFDAMLQDQQVPSGTNPVVTEDISNYCNPNFNGGNGTTDMTNFPGSASSTHASNPYTGPDKLHPVVLATHYVRDQNTLYAYTCDANGLVTQH